jgi:hypothetical protein
MQFTRNEDHFQKETDFIHFIPYVNCPELLMKSASSTVELAKAEIGVST